MRTLASVSCNAKRRPSSVRESPSAASARSAAIRSSGAGAERAFANNSDDAPWQALDYGTKRWSSYENICAKAADGTAAPGNEGSRYAQNSGEAFAEAYRVLNLQKQGQADISWEIVDPGFFPATSSPEPDGLSYTTAMQILAATVQRNRLVGFDLVELAPSLDPSGNSSLFAARLIVEMLMAAFP